MKRQDPLLSSSSCRENSHPSEYVCTKSIGCMSGIFDFIHKYHIGRRFLTSGKEQKKTAITASPSSSLPPKECSVRNSKLSHEVEVARSPTVPPEMRISSAGNLRTAPALVARLMGLNEVPTASELAVSEKRRRLLGALEKCDEDLKTLKKMIEMVNGVGDDSNTNNRKKDSVQGYYRGATVNSGELEASPITVVDEFTRWALCGYSERYTAIPTGQAPLQRRKKPGEDDIINISFADRTKTERISEKNNDSLTLPSNSTIDSVNEVCKDIAWGQRREIGRIGLTLQDHIWRELVEEIVQELGCHCLYQHLQLPLESCKRSLRF